MSLLLFGKKGYISTDVPQAEADALIAFFEATGGNGWTNNTGWGSDPVVNNWHGITVAGGHVTEIDLNTNNLVGAAGSTLDPLAINLTQLRLYINSLTTCIVTNLTSLTSLYLDNNSLTDIGTVTNLTSLTTLYLHNNSLTDIGTVTNLTSLTRLYLGNNSLTDIGNINNAVGMSNCLIQDNLFLQATVDTFVQGIYDNWAAYTYATPSLNIGGTNAAPSGVYQDGDPPTTGKEYIFEIVNDPEATGNEKWVVTYTV